ncbi:MAG: hypothetical protein ABH951_03150 [Patescibacteria group bacterium]
MKDPLVSTKNSNLSYVPVIIFIILSGWWVYINFLFPNVTTEDKQLFAAFYQILALFGAIVGFLMAKRWGGYKSLLGKALIFFSLGLLLQSFGQSVYSYFIFFQKIEIPYPSIGDIGFFGSIIAYILGVFYLSRVSGFHISWKSIQNKISSIVLPIIILAVSYFFFLKGYEFDWSDKLRIFLDFGYPFGQAIYVSIAILTLIVSRNVLGGIMKKPVLFLIFALIIQYFSDFVFLYQANAGTWSAGGVNDFMYMCSYFLMALSLIQLGSVFYKIKNS